MGSGSGGDDPRALNLPPHRLRRLVLLAVAALVLLGVTLLLALTGPGSFASRAQVPFPPPRPSPEGCEAACDECERDCLHDPENCPACSANFEECCEEANGLPLEDCQCLTEDMGAPPSPPRR